MSAIELVVVANHGAARGAGKALLELAEQRQAVEAREDLRLAHRNRSRQNSSRVSGGALAQC